MICKRIVCRLHFEKQTRGHFSAHCYTVLSITRIILVNIYIIICAQLYGFKYYKNNFSLLYI